MCMVFILFFLLFNIFKSEGGSNIKKWFGYDWQFWFPFLTSPAIL